MYRLARRCERIGRPCQEPSSFSIEDELQSSRDASRLARHRCSSLVSRLSPLVSRHDVGPLRVGNPRATSHHAEHLPLATYLCTYLHTYLPSPRPIAAYRWARSVWLGSHRVEATIRIRTAGDVCSKFESEALEGFRGALTEYCSRART